MTRLIALSVLAAGFSGCIIYDNDGTSVPRDRGERIGDDTGSIDGPDEQPEIPSVTLKLTPPQVEQGETFIGRITVEDGDFELSDVSEVLIYGDAIVDALVARSSEVLVSVTALEDASPGSVDILVELDSGLAAWMPAALEISAKGAGQSAEDFLAENPDALGTSEAGGAANDCP